MANVLLQFLNTELLIANLGVCDDLFWVLRNAFRIVSELALLALSKASCK